MLLAVLLLAYSNQSFEQPTRFYCMVRLTQLNWWIWTQGERRDLSTLFSRQLIISSISLKDLFLCFRATKCLLRPKLLNVHCLEVSNVASVANAISTSPIASLIFRLSSRYCSPFFASSLAKSSPLRITRPSTWVHQPTVGGPAHKPLGPNHEFTKFGHSEQYPRIGNLRRWDGRTNSQFWHLAWILPSLTLSDLSQNLFHRHNRIPLQPIL